MKLIDPFTISSQVQLNSQYLREMAGPQCYEIDAINNNRLKVAEIETAWIMQEMSYVDMKTLPRTAEEFKVWYRDCFLSQVSAADSFFDYLAHHSTLNELAVYVLYEEQVDGRFDDVIALAQLGLPSSAKIALAKNYWDEMGEGVEAHMHTRLFSESAAYFSKVLNGSPIAHLVKPTAEALTNGNLLLMLAIRREHCAKLLGALTLLEHTAPKRFSRTVKAMRRLGIPESTIYYHEMYVSIDAKHGNDLLNLVVLPILKDRPEMTIEVAIGVQLRLHVANRYYAMLQGKFDLMHTKPDDVIS
jgi:hypothetical protein